MTSLSAVLKLLGLSKTPGHRPPSHQDDLNLSLPMGKGERVLVGTLSRDLDGFVFEYAKDFAKSGLPPLPDFPRVDTVYRSPDLWPFFLARLPPVDRPDVRAELERRNIESDDTLKLLGSLGRRAISSPYELEPAGV